MFFVKDFINIKLINAYISKRSAEPWHITEPRGFSSFGCRLSGSSVFVHDGKEIYVESPDTVYIPSNIRYSQKSEVETVAVIHFSVEDDRPDGITVLPPEIGRDGKAMEEICNAFMHGSVTSKLNAQSMFYALLARFARFYSSIKDNRVKKAVEYMKCNFDNPELDIEGVASGLGISSVFLRKLFRDNGEDTPIRTLNGIRMNEAKRLLVQSDRSVGEVAEACGFREAKYFSSVFKENCGMTAGEYRRMYR